MERQSHQPESGGEEAAERPRTFDTGQQQPLHPRVYVAALASTERGIEHGLWIDADQTPSEIDEDIEAMLASSPVPGARLWTVRQAEDFDGIDLSTVTDSSLIAELAHGLVEHGRAFAAWARFVGNDRTRLSEFRDSYIGSYQSPEAWAWALVESLGWHRDLDRQVTDPLVRPYVVFDYEAVAQDASASWQVLTDADGTVHVFAR